MRVSGFPRKLETDTGVVRGSLGPSGGSEEGARRGCGLPPVMSSVCARLVAMTTAVTVTCELLQL